MAEQPVRRLVWISDNLRRICEEVYSGFEWGKPQSLDQIESVEKAFFVHTRSSLFREMVEEQRRGLVQPETITTTNEAADAPAATPLTESQFFEQMSEYRARGDLSDARIAKLAAWAAAGEMTATDTALLDWAQAHYVAANFAYPVDETHTVVALILEVPQATPCGADLRKTLTEASRLAPLRSSSASTDARSSGPAAAAGGGA